MVAGGEQSHCGIGRKKTKWKNLTLPFPSPLFSIFPVIYFTPRCVWRNGILEVFLPPPLHRPETAAAAYLMHYQCSASGLGFAKHLKNYSNSYIRHWSSKKATHTFQVDKLYFYSLNPAPYLSFSLAGGSGEGGESTIYSRRVSAQIKVKFSLSSFQKSQAYGGGATRASFSASAIRPYRDGERRRSIHRPNLTPATDSPIRKLAN